MDKRVQFRSESGVAMLEVLIAIIVVSFGLLGVAGLQLAGMKNSQTAYLRSTATAQAYDMADRMRANIGGVRAGNYDAITATIPSVPTCSSSFSATAGCSLSEMAKYDAYVWLTANQALLPGGSGTVTAVADSNRTRFNISVSWSEKCQAGEASCASGNVARTFSTEVSP